MNLLSPKSPPYTYKEWKSKPFPERVKMVSNYWGINGFGAPASAYIFYLVKIIIYFFIWVLFCSFSSELGGLSTIQDWWYKPEAIYRLIIWTALYESMGLGAGSGPLTGRYVPPVGGFIYWLTPGTLKLPMFPGVPVIGKDKRGWLDVLVYIIYIGLAIRVLVSPMVLPELVLPIIISIIVLGILDKPIFLAARSEHYLTAMICMLFPTDTLSAFKIIWVAIWFWAATCKVNRHFPYVIGVMVSNSGVIRLPFLKKLMYKNYPDDMRASSFSRGMAHVGTLIEYVFPIILLFSTNTDVIQITLIIMLLFHLFITLNVPMAVPIEWNVVMVYGGFALFGQYPDISAFAIQSPFVWAILFINLLLLPLLGNFFPKYISFLLSMRYYAGNWAYGIWLFRDDSHEKIDKNLIKPSKDLSKQLGILYDKDTIELVLSSMISFRMMHLHGRALHDLLPMAVDDIDNYTWREGEMMCGTLLGWNFGDGHLHGKQLLKSVQKYCNFKPGELVCILVEAQPMFRSTMSYEIVDACLGVIKKGKIRVKDLEERQPWPELSKT